MSSNSNGDGRFTIPVTFDIGTNLDIAQVQVQNRVGIAAPRLPQDVRQIGVNVVKSSPDLMLVVHLYSPDQSRDPLYVSNYANLEIKDTLTRVDGVGSITVFGERDYAMRIWLDPDRLQSLNLTATDVTLALAGAEHPGRLRRAQPAAGRDAGRVPDRGADARPARRSRTSSPTSWSRPRRRRWCASRTWRASSSPRRTTRRARISTAIRGGDGGVPAAGLERAADRQGDPRHHGNAGQAFPARHQLRHRLRSDPVHRAVGRGGAGDDPRGDPARRAGRDPVPADLARRDHPAGRDPDLADRHVLLHGAVRLLAEQPVAVRAGARGRHRGRRRHRRGGERRAQYRGGPQPARRREAQHGRGRRRADRDRAGAVRGVRAVGLHHRHFRPVLPPVRAHHRRRHHHLADRVADAVAGAVRAAAQAARRTASQPVGRADPRLLPAVQPRLRRGGARLWLAHDAGGALRRDHAGALRRHAGVRPQRIPQDADRLHPAGRSRLHHRGDAVAARRLALAHRRGEPAHRRHRAEDAGRDRAP